MTRLDSLFIYVSFMNTLLPDFSSHLSVNLYFYFRLHALPRVLFCHLSSHAPGILLPISLSHFPLLSSSVLSRYSGCMQACTWWW